MSLDLERPILYEYFDRKADVLLAKYEASKGQKATANVGPNRELFLSEFLQSVLPHRLTVGRGEILDSRRQRSGEFEIIIIRDDMPLLSFEGVANTYLVEGVLAAIEVKSNLTKEKLRDAVTALKRVRDLEPVDNYSVYSSDTLKRPLCCVFAYEGALLENLRDELLKPKNADIVDFVGVLFRGAIIAKGLLLEWGADPLGLVHGKAAALAWLYFHLASYSVSFYSRPLPESYFEPLNNWGGS